MCINKTNTLTWRFSIKVTNLLAIFQIFCFREIKKIIRNGRRWRCGASKLDWPVIYSMSVEWAHLIFCLLPKLIWKPLKASCANIYTYSVTKKVSKYCLGPARERLFKPYLITPPHFLSTDQTAKFNTSRMYVVKLDSFWTDKIGMDWR